jgi:hypothetical protein
VQWVLTVLRGLAALRLAVVLIAVYVGVLAWGTLVESRYGGAAAHFAIYDTNWFLALNALLGVNVLCAMVIRFPWKRRQIGFLVTHGGILVLLVGCLMTKEAGVEAQLPIFEGQSACRAYRDSYHFLLQVDPKQGGQAGELIFVPFVTGPFGWDRFAGLSWFPWHLAYRSQGVIYDDDRITLEVLDYRKEPQPSVRVRLAVDGKADEFDLIAASEEPAAKQQRHVIDVQKRRLTITMPMDEVELGFQLHLHRFQRKLDPGAEMPSHYSSLVDVLDQSKPPRTLAKNVLITLNAPIDLTDPANGRAYRLFQASFSGPWKPGEPEFDRLAGKDRSRDQVYLSRLSINDDPGRGLKYAGCLMIIVGIIIVYYLRRFFAAGESNGSPSIARSILAWLAAIVIGSGACTAQAGDNLDWTAWRKMPVFGEGRIVPLDTFARETVETICGRANPTLTPPDAEPRKYSAAELLFSWLAEPAKWEKRPLLLAEDATLRTEVLRLPLEDQQGRRLRYASPDEVENSPELGQRWAELQQRAETEGKEFRLVGIEKKIKVLVDAYGKYRLLTYDSAAPQDTPRRFYARVRAAAAAWRKLAGDLHGAQRISHDKEIRDLMVQTGQALQKLITQMHGEGFARDKVAPTVTAFCRPAEQLAARLTESSDRPLAALAAELRRQTVEMQLALYDNGDALRLAPALSPAAMEENREPSDDAPPWLSFQTVLFGSPDVLRPYPQAELKAVRKAWAEAKAAYLDRDAADRPARFAAAIDRFAATVRSLGEAIEPLRTKLAIQHRDDQLIAATAYPPPDSTEVELFYNRLDPFFWSWVVSLAATLCLLSAVGSARQPMFWLGAVLLLIGQAFAAVGLGLRGYITGLVPLTGMFETVVFVALYAALLGIWFAVLPLVWRGRRSASASDTALGIEALFERRPFAVAGAIVGTLAAVLAYYAPAGVMHRNLGAVTPILRDNFWLAVHVVTIMASYASAAIALVLGNLALGYYLLGRYQDGRPPKVCTRLAGFTYTAIQITVLLLAAGTILGALWADKAWGRFWAWDPKEVWALISLLVYVLILHARYIGWSGDFGMATAAVFGATAVLFTWYGVNFLLGSGMHSYGSGAGGQWQVATAVGLQWLFLAAAGLRYVWEEGD